MRTKEELATIIARQTPENNPAEIVIKHCYQSVDDEKATIVYFDCGDDPHLTKIPAVVWDDATCFTPYDWTMFPCDFEDIEWYNHEYKVRGVIMDDDLPRLFV